MSMLKLQEEVQNLSDEKLTELYSLASNVSMDVIEELCPPLLNICLEAKDNALKDQLGMVIFHLQKNERISTRIGLQKLLHGALRVDAEKVFDLLNGSGKEGEELSENIKAMF